MNFAEYLKEKKIKPYSASSAVAKTLRVSPQHVGDICRGLRCPSLEVALRIEDLTNGEVTVRDLFDFYNQVQSGDTVTETPEPIASPDPIAPPATPTPPSHTLDLFAQEPG